MLLFSTDKTKPTEGLMALDAGFTESDYRPSAIGTGSLAIAIVLSVAALFLVVDTMTLGINFIKHTGGANKMKDAGRRHGRKSGQLENAAKDIIKCK